MSRTMESMPPLEVALERILELAEPGEPIEVSLVDALGLVLAEPAMADVDLPPFDRASREGYAVKAAETVGGAFLRVAGIRRSWGSQDAAIEAGEAIRVSPGDAMPSGADAILPIEQCPMADPGWPRPG